MSQDFEFKSIKIYKSEVLGVGSYGSVYKAQCDDLECAGKVLHPNLIITEQNQLAAPPSQPHRMPINRFKKECKLLHFVKPHPNIILFLGLSQDQENDGIPVLLMELMDESLTSFLERDIKTRLPFKTQLLIIRDVSSAISFLHSNDILHRDLSSNNVLMIGDRRAKVTDFGMAVFESTHKKKTQMPGTAAYMPPEVRGNNPVSTRGVDVFSLGVLIIQIVTRLFPEPADEQNTIFRRVLSIISRPEREIERRQNHISLIDKDCPFLPIAFNCLKQEWQSRPTASEVCRQVAQLKNFIVSPLPPPSAPQKKRENNPELHQSKRSEQYCKEEMLKLGAQVQRLYVEEELEEVPHPIPEKPQNQVHDLSEMKRLVSQNRGQRMPAPMCRICDAVVVDGSIYMLHKQDRTALHSFFPRHHKWSAHAAPPVAMGSLAVVQAKVVLVGGLNSKQLFSLVGGAWQNDLHSMPTKRHSAITVSSRSHLIVVGGVGKEKKILNKVEILDIDENQWSTAASIPEPCFGLSACLCNRSFYVFGNGRSVHTCKIETLLASSSSICGKMLGEKVWVRTQDLPVSSSTGTVVGSSLFAVGGKLGSGTPTTAIYRYNPTKDSWCVYAHTKVSRSKPFVAMVTKPNVMVVAGGACGELGAASDAMETIIWR